MGTLFVRSSVTVQEQAAAWLYRALTVAARYPTVALSLARLGRYGEPLEARTEVVIEGFPRSGNSFAVAAFRRAQRRPVRIAHHLHAPGHAIAGVRAGLPTLVMLRSPDDAVPEFAASKPNIPVREILRGYVRFHEPLLPHRHGFVIGPFEEALSDFAAVIRRINERFTTSFHHFEGTGEELRVTHEDVQQDYRGRQGSAPAVLGTSRGISDDERARLIESVRRDYEASDLNGIRRRAKRVYGELLTAP